MGDQGCPPDGTVDGEQPGVRPTCPMACLGPMSLVSPWCARGHRPGLGTRRWHVSLRGQEAQVCPQVDAPALTPLLLPTQPSPGPQGVAGIVECAQATPPTPRLAHASQSQCLPRAPPAGPRAHLHWRGVPAVALHPMAPNKLAICCCLSNTFVMQIKEPAPVPRSEEEVGCFCLFLLFLSLCGCNC